MFSRVVCLLLVAVACRADSGNCPSRANTVFTGLDVLAREDFAPLAGLRIGLITNHTGLDIKGRSDIELFSEAGELKLAALFSPEHGLEGRTEGKYASGKTGADLPVYSLYGSVRKPRAEWLDNLDALVFDIQDIGTRFYTYITTLALCMQAAAENGLGFYVLDRPNPVGGLLVEGPVLEKELQGDFIAYYPIPVRHGMTVGELAGLFNTEFCIGAKLRVIRMHGWRRGMYYDDTGLKWINPSPNMRSLSAALLYPGLGIAEAANLSVGRGTELPFELYGAPYVDGKRLADELNAAHLAGIVFKDTVFVPVSHIFEGRRCGGVRAIITERGSFRSLEAGMHLLSALARLWPGTFDLSRIDRWIGRWDVKERIGRGEAVERIMADWQEGLEQFGRTRAKYLLYEP